MTNRKEYMKKYGQENKKRLNAIKQRYQRSVTDRNNIFKIKGMLKEMNIMLRGYKEETNLEDISEDKRYKLDGKVEIINKVKF